MKICVILLQYFINVSKPIILMDNIWKKASAQTYLIEPWDIDPSTGSIKNSLCGLDNVFPLPCFLGRLRIDYDKLWCARHLALFFVVLFSFFAKLLLLDVIIITFWACCSDYCFISSYNYNDFPPCFDFSSSYMITWNAKTRPLSCTIIPKRTIVNLNLTRAITSRGFY